MSGKSDISAADVEAYKQYVEVKKPWDIDKPIDLRPLKAYDVWRNRDGQFKAQIAEQPIVDDSNAPYGFDIHEIRVLARDGNDAIRKAKKA